jgi:pimeloyl-ACP methyl ester carboxylesterase
MPPAELVSTLFQNPPPPATSPPGALDIDAILAAYRDQSALARFCWSPYLSNPKLERRLHRITAPTLVVSPSQDRLIPVAHGRRYAERIPGARFTEIEDSGHAMYLERPAEFAAVTIDFAVASGLPNGASR